MAVFCGDGCFWNALYLFVWWVMLIVLVFDGSLIVFILVVCGAMDVLFLYVCIVVVGCCCLLDLVLCLMLIAFGVSLCRLWVSWVVLGICWWAFILVWFACGWVGVLWVLCLSGFCGLLSLFGVDLRCVAFRLIVGVADLVFGWVCCVVCIYVIVGCVFCGCFAIVCY